MPGPIDLSAVWYFFFGPDFWFIWNKNNKNMFPWLGFKKLFSKIRFENLFFKNKKGYFCFKKHNFKIQVFDFEIKMEKQYQKAHTWTGPKIPQPSPSPTRFKLGLRMAMPWPGPWTPPSAITLSQQSSATFPFLNF